MRPKMRNRDDSLIGQVVAANIVLVTLTVVSVSLVSKLDPTKGEQRWESWFSPWSSSSRSA